MAITDPTDIAGLELWLDASDVSTITFGTGYKGSQWDDKSGNGEHVTQATGTAQPELVNSLVRRAFRFLSASVQLMRNASAVTIAQPYTIFLVASRHTAGSSESGTVAHRSLLNTQLRIGANSAAATTYAGNAFLDQGTLPAINNPKVVSAIFDGGSSQIWINGSSTGGGNPGTNSIDLVTIGALGTSANPVNGDIGEVVVYNSALGTTDRQDVEAYLTAKWLTANPATAEVIASDAFTSTGNISSTNVPIPAHDTDDIVVILVATNQTANTIDTPSGFTAVGASSGTSNVTTRMFWKRIASTNELGSSVNVTHNAFRRTSAVSQVIRGGSTTVDPYGYKSTSTSDVTTTAPGQEITGDDTLLIAQIGYRNGGQTWPITDPDWAEDNAADGGSTNTGARCGQRTSRVDPATYVTEEVWNGSSSNNADLWLLAIESEATGDNAVNPSAHATDSSFPAFTITATAEITATHDTDSSFPAATLSGTAAVAAGNLATDSSFPAATFSTTAAITATHATDSSFPAVTISATGNVTAGNLASQSSFPAVTVTTGVNVLPNDLQTVSSFPAVQVDSSVSTGVLLSDSSFSAPTISATAGVSAGNLATDSSFPASTQSATAEITATHATDSSFPAFTVSAAADVEAGNLATVSTFPGVSVQTPGEVNPLPLLTVSSFPAMALTFDASFTPTPLFTDSSFPGMSVDDGTSGGDTGVARKGGTVWINEPWTDWPTEEEAVV